MPLVYRGILNIDYTGGETKSHESERLKNALVQAGWKWIETSAYAIETTNLGDVWRGIDLVARQSTAIGRISALTFHIQSSNHFGGDVPGTVSHHAQALSHVLKKPFPQP